MAPSSLASTPLRLHQLAKSHAWTQELLGKLPDQEVTPEQIIRDVSQATTREAYSNAFFPNDSFGYLKPLRLLGRPASWRHYMAAVQSLRTWLELEHPPEHAPTGWLANLAYAPSPNRIMMDRLTELKEIIPVARAKRRGRNEGRLEMLKTVGAQRNEEGKIMHIYSREPREPDAEEQKNYSLVRAHEIAGFVLDKRLDEKPGFPKDIESKILDSDNMADEQLKWSRRLETLQTHLTYYRAGLGRIREKIMQEVETMPLGIELDKEIQQSTEWLKKSNDLRKKLKAMMQKQGASG